MQRMIEKIVLYSFKSWWTHFC